MLNRRFEGIPFGDLLKSLRNSKGTHQKSEWSQGKVAARLGVSRVTYNGWENGVSLPSDNDLDNIVKLFALDQEEEAALYRAKRSTAPMLETLPYQRNRQFTGRDRELQAMEQALQTLPDTDVTHPLALYGLGGMGKTQLALEYAHHHYRHRYMAVFWVDATSEMTIRDGYDALARRLKLSGRTVLPADGLMTQVLDWLAAHTGWLLVLDNVTNLAYVSFFLPKRYTGHVVFTTRLRHVEAVATKLEVDTLPLTDARDFFLRRAGLLSDLEQYVGYEKRATIRYTETLVKRLGGHPLAIDQAAAYVLETGTSVGDYLRLYDARHAELLDRRGVFSRDHPESVAVTLTLSLKHACDWPSPSLAGDLLIFCSFLSASDIPEAMVQHIDSLTFDLLAFNEAIARLQAYSLLRRHTRNKSFSMHPLVQDVVIATLSYDARREWFGRVQRTVCTYAQRQEVEKRYPLLDHARSALRRADLSGTSATFVTATNVGFFLDGVPVFTPEERVQAQLEEDASSAREVLVKVEVEYGPDHPALLSCLGRLVEIYVAQKRYEQAEVVCVRSDSLYATQMRDVQIAKAVAARADFTRLLVKTIRYTAEGQITISPEGRAALLALVKTLPRIEGADDVYRGHLLMAEIYHMWAYLAERQGNHEQVVRLYEQSLAALGRFYDQPNLLQFEIVEHYAAFLRRSGRDTEASAVAAQLPSTLDRCAMENSWLCFLLAFWACELDETSLRDEFALLDEE